MVRRSVSRMRIWCARCESGAADASTRRLEDRRPTVDQFTSLASREETDNRQKDSWKLCTPPLCLVFPRSPFAWSLLPLGATRLPSPGGREISPRSRLSPPAPPLATRTTRSTRAHTRHAASAQAAVFVRRHQARPAHQRDSRRLSLERHLTRLLCDLHPSLSQWRHPSDEGPCHLRLPASAQQQRRRLRRITRSSCERRPQRGEHTDRRRRARNNRQQSVPMRRRDGTQYRPPPSHNCQTG